MRLALSSATEPPRAARGRPQPGPELPAVRFGDTLFHAAEEHEWDGVVAAARARGTRLTTLNQSVPASRLHVRRALWEF